jgi:hypothetical protein
MRGWMHVQENAAYSRALERLRELKPAIEHLQLLIEKGQKAKMAAFEVWHALLLRVSAT